MIDFNLSTNIIQKLTNCYKISSKKGVKILYIILFYTMYSFLSTKPRFKLNILKLKAQHNPRLT